MRAPACLLFLAAAAVPVAGAQAQEIAPRQDGDTALYRVEGFDSVSLGTAATVDVRVGPSWSVRASGPAEELARLRVAREGRALELRMRDGWRGGWSRSTRAVRIAITMPRITAASVSGSGRMAVDKATGEGFRAAVSGSGELALGAVRVSSLDVAISGSGNIAAAGRATQLNVRSSGSGGLLAPELRADGAAVSVAGSGRVRASVEGAATVSIAGSGSVNLGERARCTVRRAGSGRATCGA